MKYYRIVAIAAIVLIPHSVGAEVVSSTFGYAITNEVVNFTSTGGGSNDIQVVHFSNDAEINSIKTAGVTSNATCQVKIWNEEGEELYHINDLGYGAGAGSTTTVPISPAIEVEAGEDLYLDFFGGGVGTCNVRGFRQSSFNNASGCTRENTSDGDIFNHPAECTGYPTSESNVFYELSGDIEPEPKDLYFINPKWTGLSTTTSPLNLIWGVRTDENVTVQVVVREYDEPGMLVNETFSYAAGASTTGAILLSPTATTTFFVTLTMRGTGIFSGTILTEVTRWHYKPQGGLSPYEKRYGEEKADGSGQTVDQSDDGEGAGTGECSITDLTGCFKIALSWAFKPSDENILELKSRAADAAFIWPFGYVTNFVTYFTEMETSTTTKPGNIVIPFSDIDGSGMDDVTILDWDAIEATSTRIQEAEEAFAVPINMLMSVLFVFMVVSTVRGMAGEKDTA